MTYLRTLLKRGLFSKERICSHGEQILSFKIRHLSRRKTKLMLQLPPPPPAPPPPPPSTPHPPTDPPLENVHIVLKMCFVSKRTIHVTKLIALSRPLNLKSDKDQMINILRLVYDLHKRFEINMQKSIGSWNPRFDHIWLKPLDIDFIKLLIS